MGLRKRGRKKGSRNKYKRGKDWRAGSKEPWEQSFRKKRSGKSTGWFGQSNRHRKAAIKGHRKRK